MPKASEIDKQGLMSLLEASKKLSCDYRWLLRKVRDAETPPVTAIISGSFLVNESWINKMREREVKGPTRFIKPKPYMKGTANPLTTELLIEVTKTLSDLEERLNDSSTQRFGPILEYVCYEIITLLKRISDYNISGIDTSEDAINNLEENVKTVLGALLYEVNEHNLTEAKKLVSYYNTLVFHLSEIEGLQNA